jgi:hypothetical protein
VQSLTTGGSNTAVGHLAMDAATTASSSCAVGRNALTNMTTGSSNVCMGDNSGNSITDSSDNTIVGSLAGNTGNISQCTIIGKGAFANAQDGDSTSIFIGYNCGHNANALSQNTAVGTQSLQECHSSNNSAFGFQALINNTTGSGHNTAVGHSAMLDTTDGDTNTAIGASALRVNQSGDRNTAVGYEALYNSNVDMDVFNVAVGYQAGRASTTGYQNTFLGPEAGKNNTTGIQNTAVGPFADDANTTGSNNVTIGNNARPSTNTVSNQITLGNTSNDTLRCNVQTISSLSDRRDKTDIVDLPIGLDFINTLKPRKFKWATRDGNVKDGRYNAGFIAQELQSAEASIDYLYLVMNENPERLETKEGHLLPVMVKAIQELSAKVTALEGN